MRTLKNALGEIFENWAEYKQMFGNFFIIVVIDLDKNNDVKSKPEATKSDKAVDEAVNLFGEDNVDIKND